MKVRDWAEDLMVSFLMEQGCGGLQVLEEAEGSVLLAYCPTREQAQSLSQVSRSYALALKEINGATAVISVTLEQVIDPGWAQAWKSHFRPSRVSRRVAVCPPWEPYEGSEGVHVIQIDPGQAFGTGLHETTRLCIEWLDELLVDERVPEVALDLGTGTGILAMAMARLGVGRVVAVDVDPLAVEAARENLRANRLHERVEVLEGSLAAVGTQVFPLVVANLTGTALRENARELAARVCAQGALLVSGILDEETACVVESFSRAGMVERGLRKRGEWCALFLVKGA